MWIAWIMTGILGAVVLALMIKLFLIRRSLRELQEEFEDCLRTDTNLLIHTSSGDRSVRALAAKINEQLRILRKQRQKYLRGDRELKETVTNLSHDLRTPLTAVCGYLELMEKEPVSEDGKRYLSLISNRVQAIRELMEELFRYSLILSRESELNIEKVSLNAILEEASAGFYQALREKEIQPEIVMPDKPVFCMADRKALLRVFENILNNAVKYSDGDLTILLSESGRVRFINTASKLDRVSAKRLFDRFYTVETAKNSTGLGLAIAKTLTEQMHGKIDAKFEKGKLFIEIDLLKE